MELLKVGQTILMVFQNGETSEGSLAMDLKVFTDADGTLHPVETPGEKGWQENVLCSEGNRRSLRFTNQIHQTHSGDPKVAK